MRTSTRIVLTALTALTVLYLVFAWAMGVAYADGPYRPTGHYDVQGTSVTNPTNGYDTSDTSYADHDIGLLSADSLDVYYGRNSGNADAWNITATSGACTSATIGIRYSHVNAGNDWSTITVVNSADTVLYTIRARSQNDQATTWVYQGLTSGEAGDYADLRVTVWGDRQGGNGAEALYMYDIRIDGTGCETSARKRMINMTKEVQDEKIHRPTGPAVATVRSRSVRRDNANQ